jgi:hypothetical protein
MLFVFLYMCCGLNSTVAQPPGTPPPKQMFDQNEVQDALPIGAFMFQSESGNLVMVPGLTWEELERLQNLDAGTDSARQPFSYQSLVVTGSTDRKRAELEVVLRLTIEPTEGRWVSIPLRMGNFFRLAPPDVEGVEEYRMTLAPDNTGYLLLVKTDTQKEAMLRMRVAARVDTSSAAQTLAFRFPDVPSTVELTTDAENVVGEVVVGRGDEAIVTERAAGDRTKFTVNSGGGTFSLRWGRLARSTDNLPLFEVESRVRVLWESPQDQPKATVRLTVRNVRGSIASFQLRLPSGSVVREPPRLGIISGQTIELGTATNDRNGEIREVIIPEEERQQQIDLNLELQLANDNASASSPLGFRVPEVVGALRHRGEIEIQTGGDYRLRWRAASWIRSELGESQDEGSSGRSYRFRFDRTSYELPELDLWLGEKERQLRMISKSKISILESIASLDMTVQVTGQTADGRLHFDDASWRISSIEDTETGEALESFISDSVRAIEFNTAGSEEPAPIRVRAEHPLESGPGQAKFELPHVVAAGDTALVQSETVDIVNNGRSMLVVDLKASSGLSPVVSSVAEANSSSPVSSFRIVTQDNPAIVVGSLVDQPPRINLASNATIELDGQQLRTTVEWTVTSGLDLEGRLPIRIPRSSLVVPAARDDAAALPVLSTSASQSGEGVSADPWLVTVNEWPATLRALNDDDYELISDHLASGSMTIRWQLAQNLRSTALGGSIESVSLPRPDITDVTVRGAMRVTLRGNQQFNLIPIDSPAITELDLETLPRDPMRLRLESKSTAREELSIRKTILRTTVGRNTRYEQVLARIQGGENFRVGLPDSAQEVSVEAFIDGQPVSVRREGNTLILALLGDTETHVVDLRVWIAATTSSSFALVQPTLKLPVGVGQVLWQIVAPRDGHAVWASPTLGRSMTWRFKKWELYREPNYSDRALTATSPDTTPNPLPPDINRYLYVGSDLRSFQVVVVSRVVLWIFIGSFVLVTAVMLTNFPQSRHPLTAVAGAILFGGLIAVAPDAAVLAGQFGIISMVLVILMTAIRSLIRPSQSNRVFSSRGTSSSKSPSTQSQKRLVLSETASGVTTQALPGPSPSEASS